MYYFTVCFFICFIIKYWFLSVFLFIYFYFKTWRFKRGPNWNTFQFENNSFPSFWKFFRLLLSLFFIIIICLSFVINLYLYIVQDALIRPQAYGMRLSVFFFLLFFLFVWMMVFPVFICLTWNSLVKLLPMRSALSLSYRAWCRWRWSVSFFDSAA